VLALQHKVLHAVSKTPKTASEIGEALQEDAESVYHVLRHLVANRDGFECEAGAGPGADRFYRA